MAQRTQNPYVAGPPVRGKVFFGREDVFRFVNETLELPGQNSVVLFGQRRIGKTSILHALLHHLEGDLCTVYFDLMGKAGDSLSDVLYDLARRIARSLEMAPPDRSAFTSEYDRAFREAFLPQVYQELGQRRLVLLFDEFDVLGEESPDGDAAERKLFPYLQSLLADETKLAFVFAVGRRIEELPSNLQAVFKTALFKRVSFLREDVATALIRQPVEGIIEYQDEAVERILDWSSGHPYFTQLICSELFRFLRQKEEQVHVTPQDVDRVVDVAIERGAAAFAWFWGGLPQAERVILAAIAHIVEEEGFATGRTIRDTLQRFGVRLLGIELADAPQKLVEWEILRREKDDSYRFAVRIIHRWVLKEHSIEGAQRGLERISPRALSLYEAALEAQRDGNLSEAVKHFRDALVANPNLLRARLGLAEVLYRQGRLEEAVSEYEQLYRLDEISARYGLIEALMAWGRSLEKQGAYVEATAKYARVLELEPSNKKEILDNLSEAQRMAKLVRAERQDRSGPLDLDHPDGAHLSRTLTQKLYEWSKFRRFQFYFLLIVTVAIIAVLSGLAMSLFSSVFFQNTPTSTPEDTTIPTFAPTDTSVVKPVSTPTSTSTSTPTQTPSSTSTPTPTDTPTLMPTLTDTPTLTPTPTGTPTFTPTPTRKPVSTPALFVYPPPFLIGAGIIGCNVTLRWVWLETLADDEWFSVRVGIEVPHSVTWVKENEYTYSLFGDAGQYSWEIAICRGDPATGHCEELAVSERRFFFFGGCSTPLAPTPFVPTPCPAPP
jgi:tetratricopeptide (TPR) repeat protein